MRMLNKTLFLVALVASCMVGLNYAGPNTLVVDQTDVSVYEPDYLDDVLLIPDIALMSWNLSRVGDTSVEYDVTFSITGGTATLNVDYTVNSTQTITFAPNQIYQEILLTVLGDDTYEYDETILITVSFTNTTGSETINLVGTILNNDDPPSVSVVGGSITEGNSGSQTFNFSITLSPISAVPAVVNYTTVDHTATAGSDYSFVSGTVTFQPGESEKIIPVLIYGDTVFEGDEDFYMQITGFADCEPDQDQGTCQIIEDDPAPVVTVQSSTVVSSETEGVCQFVFQYSFASSVSSTFYITTNVSASTTDKNFYYKDTGLVGFTTAFNVDPQTSTYYWNLTIVDDAIAENTEYAVFNILSGLFINVIPGFTQLTCVIQDNDPLPTFFVVDDPDYSVYEGVAGDFPTVAVHIGLSGLSEITYFSYQTADGTALLSDNDYDSLSQSTQVVFANAPTPDMYITVTVVGDDKPEGDEYFYLDFSNITGVASVVNSTARINILTDEEVPYFSLSTSQNTSVIEGGDGQTTNITFTISLDQTPLYTPTTVSYTIIPISTYAIAGKDYTAVTQTVSFAPTDIQKTFSISILGDSINEDNEIINVQLYNPVNAGVTEATGYVYVTIIDDDPLPTLSISDLGLAERNLGDFSAANVPLTLSPESGRVVTVQWETQDGTALEGSDYNATSGTITILPGATSAIASVIIIGDDTKEPDETFTIQLSDCSGATLATTFGTVTILNDDGISSGGGKNGGSNTGTIIIAVVVPFVVLGAAAILVAVLLERKRKRERRERELQEMAAQQSGTGTRQRRQVRRKKNANPDAKTDDEGSVLECTDSDIDSDDYLSESNSESSLSSDESDKSEGSTTKIKKDKKEKEKDKKENNNNNNNSVDV